MRRARPHSDEYKRLLESQEWQDFRSRIIRDRDNKCEACDADGTYTTLQVHHLTYVRLGREWNSDVQLLCIPCHELADEKRKQTTWYKGKRIHKTKRTRKRRRRRVV